MDRKKIGILLIVIAALVVGASVFYFAIWPSISKPTIPTVNSAEIEDFVDPDVEDNPFELPGESAEPTGDAWADDSLAKEEAVVDEEFDINDMLPGGGQLEDTSGDELMLPPSVVSSQEAAEALPIGGEVADYFSRYSAVVSTGINGVNLSATDLYEIAGTTAKFKDGDVELYLSVEPFSEDMKASFTQTFTRDTYTNPDSVVRVFGLLYAVRGEAADSKGRDDYQEFKSNIVLPVNFSGLVHEYGSGVDVKVQDTLVHMEATANGDNVDLHMYMVLPKVRMVESKTASADADAVVQTSPKTNTGKWED